MAPAAANELPSRRVAGPRRVVIVSIPRLGWDDVEPDRMPALAALADRGATGSLSVRAIGRRTGPAEGYATLGAGGRATATDNALASGYAPDAHVRGGPTAGEVLRRAGAGQRPGRAAIVVPGIKAVANENEGTHQGIEVGALGDALRRAGWSTAVIADGKGWAPGNGPAALAVVDRAGLVDGGLSDSSRPTGTSTRDRDPGTVAQLVSSVSVEQSFLVVEVGDVARSDAAHGDRDARRAAARRADAVLAAVVARLDLDQDLLVVVAPVAPSPQEQPTPFVLAGRWVDRGLVRSATTRTAGHVTLTDVAPAVLARLHIRRPDSMSGTPITVVPNDRSGLRRLALARTAAAETRFVDRSAGRILSTLPITFAAWSVLLLGSTVLPLRRWRSPARTFLRWAGLMISAMPVVSFALGAVSTRSWGQPAWFFVLFGFAAVLGGAAYQLGRGPGRPRWWAPTALAALTWLLLVGDVVTGARLQFDTALGNSPTVAGRYAGIGNLAFGLLAATTLVVAVSLAHLTRVAMAAGVFAVGIVVDGAPWWGSDVGGVLALAPTAALVLWLLSGRRLSWRPLVGAAGIGVVLVGLFGVIDLGRDASERTHLGRLLAGDGQARETVVRKALQAASTVQRSSLAWVIVCTVGLAAIAWVLRPAAVRQLFAPGSTSRVLAVGALVLGVLGGALNDSGVMVPAMMAFVFVPMAVFVLVDSDGTTDAEPDPDAGVHAGQARRQDVVPTRSSTALL